jgi:hypothetical protein
MLYVWRVTAGDFLLLLVWALHLLVRKQGGAGERTEERTVGDKPGSEEDLPP